MTTALKLIKRAFSIAGIRASETALSPSELEDGLDSLNDLLKVWNATGALKGVSALDDSDDDVTCQEHEEPAIKAELAKKLCIEYSKVVSIDLKEMVRTTKRDMLSANQNLEDVDFPPTLPKGSGEFFSDKNERNF